MMILEVIRSIMREKSSFSLKLFLVPTTIPPLPFIPKIKRILADLKKNIEEISEVLGRVLNYQPLFFWGCLSQIYFISKTFEKTNTP